MKEAMIEFATIVMPAVLQMLGVVLSVILMRASLAARQRWGVEVEANDRDALHSALMTGVRAALERGLRRSAAVSAAIDYAEDSVPDAVSRLHPTRQVLVELATAKLNEVQPDREAPRAPSGEPA